MDIAALAAELSGNPGVYSSLSDAEAAVELNAEVVESNITSMTASEVMNAIDVTEWNALTDAQRQTIWDVLHLGTINPHGVEATLFQNVFGASTTITALQALRVKLISQAAYLKLGGIVRVGHVQQARA